MGYKSDIYIKVEKELTQQLIDVLHEAGIEPDQFGSDGYYTYASVEWVKWYDHFDDVKKVNAFFDSLPSWDEDGPTGGMLSIGEDNATDQWGNCGEVDLYISASPSGFDLTNQTQFPPKSQIRRT